MSAVVDIKPGQWVLAFDEGFYDGSDMASWLERFTTWGGGWDGFRAEEIYVIHEVTDVKPKTYFALQRSRRKPDQREVVRASRFFVIQAFTTERQAQAFRDKFHAIGVETTGRIKAEMYRRIENYAAREESKALKKIHRCMPHIFEKDSK